MLLDSVAHFTQRIDTDEFYVETDNGNFIFSDPQAGGSNTLKPCSFSYAQWTRKYGKAIRDRGRHVIRNFCGNGVRVVAE